MLDRKKKTSSLTIPVERAGKLLAKLSFAKDALKNSPKSNSAAENDGWCAWRESVAHHPLSFRSAFRVFSSLFERGSTLYDGILSEIITAESAYKSHGGAGTGHVIGSVMPIKKIRFGGSCPGITILKHSFFRRMKMLRHAPVGGMRSTEKIGIR